MNTETKFNACVLISFVILALALCGSLFNLGALHYIVLFVAYITTGICAKGYSKKLALEQASMTSEMKNESRRIPGKEAEVNQNRGVAIIFFASIGVIALCILLLPVSTWSNADRVGRLFILFGVIRFFEVRNGEPLHASGVALIIAGFVYMKIG